MALTLFSLAVLAVSPSFVTADVASNLEACLATSRVVAVTSSNSSYAVDSTPWQLRFKPKPAAIVHPTTTDEVAAALKCARQNSMKVSAMAAGHSFAALGFGFDGNLVVNMSAFNDITYDPSTTNVKYGAGNRIGPVVDKLWTEHKRHFPHVRHGHVGAAGSTIGGGFGATSRFLGTPMDSLVAVEYMLYNGTIVKAAKGSDLFWAACGAASSFGVLLSLTTKTYAITYPTMTQYNLTVGTGKAAAARADLASGVGIQAVLALQTFALTKAPDTFTARWYITGFRATGQYYGDPATFESAVRQPLLALMPNTTTITSSVQDFWESEKDMMPGLGEPNGGFSSGRSFYNQAVTTTADKPLTKEQLTTLFTATISTFNRTDMSVSGLLDLWGGVSSKIKDSDTAYAHGNNLWLIRLDGNSKNDTATAFPNDGVPYMKALIKPFERSLTNAGVKLRGFANYRDTALPKSEWTQRIHGNNYARLVRIKNVYDPQGMFTSNAQSISTSA